MQTLFFHSVTSEKYIKNMEHGTCFYKSNAVYVNFYRASDDFGVLQHFM